MRGTALVAMAAILTGCGGDGEEAGEPVIDVSPSTMPQASPELAQVPPPEIPAERGAEWSDGLAARIVSITDRPHESDPDGGNLMLSVTWELSNTGDAPIPFVESLTINPSFDDVLYYGVNRQQSVAYHPVERLSCDGDLPQQLVPGATVQCGTDHLVQSPPGELRVEVTHVEERVILTGVERLA